MVENPSPPTPAKPCAVYLHIDRAIEWVEKECRESPRYAREAAKGVPGTRVLARPRRAKRQHEAGVMEMETV